MGRYYHLSKKIKHEQLQQIVSEICDLDDVDTAEMNENEDCIKIVTKDDQFTDVMNIAVNIFRKEGNNADISFVGFAYGNQICWG